MVEVKVFRRIDSKIAYIKSPEILIKNESDAIEMIGEYRSQDFERVVLHEYNLAPEFFDLKTGIAGEVLQKFSNYRLGLTVIGDFKKYNSNSLSEFIRESNKQGNAKFASTFEDAMPGFGSE